MISSEQAEAESKAADIHWLRERVGARDAEEKVLRGAHTCADELKT